MSSLVSEAQSSQKVVAPMVSGIWNQPATIELNNFKYKSLSNLSFNTAVGCAHGCRFCYVPSTATRKQAPTLSTLGVNDPDADWGNYVFPRIWEEKMFLRSLARADAVPLADLKPDGHRAVMFCTTTDPYQVIRNPDPRVGGPTHH